MGFQRLFKKKKNAKNINVSGYTFGIPQLDSDRPSPRMTLVMELEREERRLSEVQKDNQKGKASSNPNSSLLQYDRKTDPAVISQKQSEYLSKNKNSFEHLINQIKQRKENLPPAQAQVKSPSVSPVKAKSPNISLKKADGGRNPIESKIVHIISDDSEEEQLRDFYLPSPIKGLNHHPGSQSPKASTSGYAKPLPKLVSASDVGSKSSQPLTTAVAHAEASKPEAQEVAATESLDTTELKDLVSDTVAEICASFKGGGSPILEKKLSSASSEDLFKDYSSDKSFSQGQRALGSPESGENYLDGQPSDEKLIQTPERETETPQKSNANDSNVACSEIGSTKKERKHSSDDEYVPCDDGSDLDDFMPLTQQERGATKRHRDQKPKGSAKKRKQPSTKGKSECPACGQYVPTHLINSHLDYCCLSPPEVTPDILVEGDEECGDNQNQHLVFGQSPVKTRSRRAKQAKT